MLKLVGIAFATVICTVILKDKAPAFTVMISVAGICILLFVTINQAGDLIKKITEIANEIPSSMSYVKLMIKILIITIITQILTDICRDNGENSIATVTEIGAKIIIISLVLPIFESVITIVLGLLK